MKIKAALTLDMEFEGLNQKQVDAIVAQIAHHIKHNLDDAVSEAMYANGDSGQADALYTLKSESRNTKRGKTFKD